MFRLFDVLPLFLLFLLRNVFAQYGTDCLLPNQEKSGLCVPIKSCKPTLEFLNKILLNPGGLPTPAERDELLALQCGQTKKGPLVCCSEDDIQLNPEGLDILKNTTCGQYSTDKVSNGYDAILFGFPWMALLKYKDRLVPFKCGGTIISDQYVLTAAHCVTPDLEGVRLGEHQISTERDCTNIRRKSICAPPVLDIDFEEIIVHEKYVRNLYHDIALLRLRRKIEFQRHMKPICLPIYDDLRNKSYEQYVISGWGTTENGSLADVLQVAVVPKLEHEQCQSWLRTHGLRLPLTMGQICAGGKGLVDTCKGDSGGPLGYRDFYNGYPRFIQFGVVSFGLNSCGGIDVPTSYTNTSYYMQWITDHMR